MINAYRKPLDPSTLVIEIEGREDALDLHGDLVQTSGKRSRAWGGVTRHLEAYLAGAEMSPEAEGGPYTVHRDTNGRDWFVGVQGWGIGSTFTKESIAREAAATLNELVKLDRRPAREEYTEAEKASLLKSIETDA